MNPRTLVSGLSAVVLGAAVVAWFALRGGTDASGARSDGGDAIDDGENAGNPGGSRSASSASTTPSASDAALSGLPTIDREKRDRLRALIWQSFGEEAPDAGSPAAAAYVLPELPPWPEGPSSDAAPGIDPQYIQDRVHNEFFPLARKCYADLSERVPDAGGSAVLAFDIVGNKNIGGIVEQVDMLNKSTLRDPAFVDCMRQSFLGVTFPAPEGGGAVQVEYPILFSPDEPDE